MASQEELIALLTPWDEYHKAFESLDPAKIGALYDENVVLVDLTRQAVIQGRQSIIDGFLKEMTAIGKPTEVHTHTKTVARLGDLISLLGNYEMKTAAFTETGDFVHLYKKSGDRYVIMHEVFSAKRTPV